MGGSKPPPPFQSNRCRNWGQRPPFPPENMFSGFFQTQEDVCFLCTYVSGKSPNLPNNTLRGQTYTFSYMTLYLCYGGQSVSPFSLNNGCLPLFFFGFCERVQILSGIAKSRIWQGFLSFCALILFEPFSLLFGVLGSTCAKWYSVSTPKWSMVAARWQRDGNGKCGGSAAAARQR